MPSYYVLDLYIRPYMLIETRLRGVPCIIWILAVPGVAVCCSMLQHVAIIAVCWKFEVVIRM